MLTSDNNLKNICYSSSCGRNHYKFRCSIVFENYKQAIKKLEKIKIPFIYEDYISNKKSPNTYRNASGDFLLNFIKNIIYHFPFFEFEEKNKNEDLIFKMNSENIIRSFFKFLEFPNNLNIDFDIDNLLFYNNEKFILSNISDPYEILSILWSHGLNFNWSLLYKKLNVKKVSIPTYPFNP